MKHQQPIGTEETAVKSCHELNNRQSATNLRLWLLLVVACFFCVSCSGCGSKSPVPLAKAGGKVTLNGQPVTTGRILFRPIRKAESKSAIVGKIARAAIDENGEFVLTSYSQGDGAAVGDHRVQLIAATGRDDDDDDDDKKKKNKLPGKIPDGFTVSVQPDEDNYFEIKLEPFEE